MSNRLFSMQSECIHLAHVMIGCFVLPFTLSRIEFVRRPFLVAMAWESGAPLGGIRYTPPVARRSGLCIMHSQVHRLRWFDLICFQLNLSQADA